MCRSPYVTRSSSESWCTEPVAVSFFPGYGGSVPILAAALLCRVAVILLLTGVTAPLQEAWAASASLWGLALQGKLRNFAAVGPETAMAFLWCHRIVTHPLPIRSRL